MIPATNRYGKQLSTEVCDYTVSAAYAPTSRNEPRPTRKRLFGRLRLCLRTVQRQSGQAHVAAGHAFYSRGGYWYVGMTLVNEEETRMPNDFVHRG